MWKLVVVLMVTALCVHAEEEQAKNDPQSSSLIETMLCYVTPKPFSCLKEQTGRMLNYWEAKVEEKRQQLMVQADEEMKESGSSRGLTDEESKERPSELMNALEKGFSALANIVSDEVSLFRGGRALDKQDTKQIDDDTNDFNDDFTLYDIAKTEEGKGKKGKKGKKGMVKLFFLGAILKSKIEMLLKILSFHLQLKFLAIALINMVINLARFWIDLKKQPQKVVYVEHAQHQHHYDEHDDWGNSWKRNTAQQDQYQGDFAHRLAYSNSGYPSHTTY